MLHSDATDHSPVVQPPPKKGWLMPVLSSLVFGTIGAWIGRSIGRRADNETRKMASRILPWGIGSMFALIALYSARQTPEPDQAELGAAQKDKLPVHAPTAENKLSAPLASVEANASEHQGMLTQSHYQQRA